MALQKRISYRWRLFFPMVGLLWFSMIVLFYFQFDREERYLTENANNQVALINNRIVNAYENNVDLVPFIRFIKDYFESIPYEQVNISIYDNKDSLLHCVGEKIPPIEILHDSITDDATKLHKDSESHLFDRSKVFFYSQISDDGMVKVYTTMPFNISLKDAVLGGSGMWILVLSLFIAVTLIAYYATRYFGENVELLRDFAQRAAEDKNFVSEDNFPHDELGEISRRIVHIYNEKNKAIAENEHEHKTAIKAILEKTELKRELANSINHELKNPIGIIKGYVDTMIVDPNMDVDTRIHFLQKSQQHIKRLCSLLEDISIMTRLNDGKQSLIPEKVDFHELVFTLANDVKESNALNGMVFIFNVPLDCDVWGNYALLNDALLNLVKNSVAYSKGTYMSLSLIEEDDNFFRFNFYDNGIGVPEELISKLFDDFFRVDKNLSRKSGGTGLGLPIVKKTITTFGGNIEAYNRPKGGLGFKFTLRRHKTSSNKTNE